MGESTSENVTGMDDQNHELLMRYLDGELPPAQRAAFENRLGSDSELKREVSIYQAMQAGFGDLSFDPRTLRAGVWERVNRQLTRPVGWGLVVIGTLAWTVFGVYTFITSPADLWEKLATGAIAIGLLVLLGSVILERYHDWLTDPYRDVHR